MAQNWGRFTAYTPDITAGVTPPTLGTGSTAEGFYRMEGTEVKGQATFVFGTSGANAGEGAYGISLPVEPINRIQPLGIAYMADNSDNIRIMLGAFAVIPDLYASSLSRGIILQSNAATDGFGDGNNPVGAAVPWTWAASDQIIVKFRYEAA